MVSSKLYFDIRRPDKKGRGVLRIVITKRGTTSMFSTGIKLFPDQWDGNMVVKHPDSKVLNSALKIKVGSVERLLIELTNEGRFAGKKASEIVAVLQEELDPMTAQKRENDKHRRDLQTNGVFAYFRRYSALKANDGTRKLYEDTYSKLLVFCKDNQIDCSSLSFDEVNRSFLTSFEQYCMKTQKQNTASRHLRDIRAVFNSAIDDGITKNYPFRKFKIKKEETKDKSFTAEELRSLFNHKCYPGWEQECVDMFKLMFCLIGINSVDLAYAALPIVSRSTSAHRLDYIRRKTGKRYSVLLEREAMDIIIKYRGNKYLLDLLERVPNYKTYFNRMAKTLRKVGTVRVPGRMSTGEAIVPDICTGSARTSWATIAQEELGIPREVIAAALGHSTVDVTSTYLRTEWQQKVDEANRRVLDWVFYGKK